MKVPWVVGRPHSSPAALPGGPSLILTLHLPPGGGSGAGLWRACLPAEQLERAGRTAGVGVPGGHHRGHGLCWWCQDPGHPASPASAAHTQTAKVGGGMAFWAGQDGSGVQSGPWSRPDGVGAGPELSWDHQDETRWVYKAIRGHIPGSWSAWHSLWAQWHPLTLQCYF